MDEETNKCKWVFIISAAWPIITSSAVYDTCEPCARGWAELLSGNSVAECEKKRLLCDFLSCPLHLALFVEIFYLASAFALYAAQKFKTIAYCSEWWQQAFLCFCDRVSLLVQNSAAHTTPAYPIQQTPSRNRISHTVRRYAEESS